MGIKTGNMNNTGLTRDNLLEVSLLTSLARSAERFTAGERWREGINDLLGDLGRITGVSRVWIFQVLELDAEKITQDYTYEWASAPEYKQLDFPVFRKFTNKLGSGDYRKLVESRMSGEWQKVITSRLSDSFLKTSQTNQNIQSMLTIPIMVDNQLWGVLGFDDCEREYDWSDTEIALLRIASFFIASAILQNRLTVKEKQFGIMQRIVSSGAWEYDVESGHLWSNVNQLSPFLFAEGEVHLSRNDFLKRVHGDDRRDLYEKISSFLAGRENLFTHDLRIRDIAGRYHWVEIISTLGRNSKGFPSKISGIVIDISQRKEKESLLKKAAETDSLTGISNRRMFEHKFHALFESCKNRKSRFSLLIIDIDFFKKVNDTWGHTAGDQVLKHLTILCIKNLRERDVFARVGGEEFALILQDATEETGRTIGERIRKSVESTPTIVAGESISLTISIGCAAYSREDRELTLYSKADQALYRAKSTGRNRVVCHSDSV